MEYTRKYLIHYSEIDGKRRLTVPTLIHYLEDIAVLNSEAQGLTLDYYEKNSCGWMLLKWDIIIHRLPLFNETIKIITRPYSFKNFLANRQYKIFDSSENLLVEAKTVWLLADIISRKPLRVPEEMYIKFDTARDSDKYFDKLEDLKPTNLGNHSLRIKVCEQDIDTNKHVNNVKYVEWALQSLPSDFVSSHFVYRVIVNYKKELNLDDEAVVIGSIHNADEKTESSHSVFSGEKEVCHLKFFWESE